MTIKKLEIFVIVSIIAVFGIVYAFLQKPAHQPVVAQMSEQPADDSSSAAPMMATGIRPDARDTNYNPDTTPQTTIEYMGQDGKNALELLQASHQVLLKHFDFGDMITSIDGITPDAKHFWALYVNDQFSQVGASALVTKNTDKLKWELDAIVDPTK